MIDAATQQELRRRYNPDGSELRELQLRMLEMLKFIDRVCADHGITWWLSSGSCLGAVRHGGFIPWDDDVDIEMLEKDYRKFLQVMGTDPHGDYVLQTRANEPDYIMRSAKLRDLRSELTETNGADATFRYRGAFIDVFHLVPSSSRKLHDWAIFLEKRNFSPAARRTPGGKLIQGAKAVTFPLLRVLDRIGAGGQLRHPIGSFFTAPRRLDDLLPTVRVPFEGVMLPVPANADAYLRRMFGDYMQLPPADKIPSHFSGIRILK